MDNKTENICNNGFLLQIPELKDISTPEGIELEGHSFLLSPKACCAQTTLPYWAKVMGRIRNSSGREIIINTTVTLTGKDNATVGKHSETMIIEAGQKGEFDVKLIEPNPDIRAYSIEIIEIDEEML